MSTRPRLSIAFAVALLLAMGAAHHRELSPVALAVAETAGAQDATPFYAIHYSRRPGIAELTALGQAMFVDPGLSASAKSACASCHDPAHAFGPPNALPVQRSGPDLRQQGVRAAPSLTYRQNVPAFTEHFFDADDNDSEDQGPAGGLMWDGRVQSTHDQAKLPLFAQNEMANASVAAVAAKLRTARYAADIRAAFGADVFDDDRRAFAAALWALEVFQQDAAQFYPYTSKYDAYLRGQANLSAAERRGLELFDAEDKGNCASCHPSSMKRGALPQFTDHGYLALAVPRNHALAQNADAAFYDLGLCGPVRRDLAAHPEYCGLFRTPSLRNVALRKAFFHNGAMHSLDDVVAFYATRDTDPVRWYGRRADGKPDLYNDLPVRYRDNINRDPPFDRVAGQDPALSTAEINDIVAFLKTLSDGWRPR